MLDRHSRSDIESLWPSKFTCLWDCHSPACVPCLVGLAVAMDLLLLQPSLDRTMSDWADDRGRGQPQGRKLQAPAMLTSPKRSGLEDVHLSLQTSVVDVQSAENGWPGPFLPFGCASGRGCYDLTLSVLV